MNTELKRTIENKRRMAYDRCESGLNCRTAKITRQEEIKKLRSLGLTDARLSSVFAFYCSYPSIKLGEISKCLEKVENVLAKCGMNQSEIIDFVNTGNNAPIYQNLYANLMARMTLFNKAHILKTVIISKGSLLANSYENNSKCVETIKTYLESKDYKVTKDEIMSELYCDHLGIIRIKQKVKKLKLDTQIDG